MSQESNLIRIRDLSIQRQNETVCIVADFHIVNGEKVGIYGESGSGKSSFLDILASKLFSFQGTVEKISSNEIILVPRDYSFNAILGHALQYYQQRYHAHDSQIGPTLFEVLQGQVVPIGTINESSVNVPEPLYSLEEIDSISSLFHVKHLLHRKLITLSNGETRRSLLCYALLKRPKLLLLDNPFSGLDSESKNILQGILNDLDIAFILISSPKEFPSSIKRVYNFSREGVREEVTPVQAHDFDLPHSSYFSLFEFTPKVEYNIIFSIKNGWVKYGENYALSDITWEIKDKEKWAIMGPNGSGKSTLLSLMLADHPQAYQNDILLFDKPRGSGESIWDIKRRIGYLSPEMHLFFPKNQRVWKVIGSGFFDTIGLINSLSVPQEKRISAIMNLFQITHLKEKTLSTISTGEQRLVLLARALIKDPPLLVLDEPCQNLDYTHMVRFRELINQLTIRFQKTLVFVTHNPEEIPSCVNKTLYLENGKLVPRPVSLL